MERKRLLQVAVSLMFSILATAAFYYPGRKSNRISHAVRCGLDHFCHCDTSGELAGKAIEDRKEAGNSNDCYHGHWADRFSGIFCSQQDCSGSDRSDSELSGYLMHSWKRGSREIGNTLSGAVQQAFPGECRMGGQR